MRVRGRRQRQRDLPEAGPETVAGNGQDQPLCYVSTVVHRTNVDGMWDHDCGGPFCYGVPLYRQYLTTSEMSQWSDKKCNEIGEKVTPTECRWPFIRMAGTDIAQRQTMTVNNGRYYLDTNVSKE